ncbi:MAG TPA: FtsQ-type POTRA domain-containing protein [Desulfomonilaceae bacterium]|nr:FtsQ-type POTRA domain-containing protein [Desulfomonilaceae bacterium]
MTEKSRPLIIDKKPGSKDVAEIRKRNRVLLKSLLVACISINAVLGLLIAYMLFLHMPYFNVQQVDVTGNRRLSRTEVIEASEMDGNMNLLTVDLNAIAEKLRRHPWIRSASVYRRLPGQIIVEIDERTPRAIVCAGKLYYVDEQAELFTRLLPGDPVDYPLFTGMTSDELKVHGPEIQELVRQGFSLLELLERSGTDLDQSGIAELRMNLDEGLTVQTRSGRMIVFGKNDFELKLHRYGRLKRFLTQTGEWNNAQIISLDFEDRALVRSEKARLQG